jgi:hypothetical protein
MFLLHILDCLTVNKQTIVGSGGNEDVFWDVAL